MSSPFDHLPPMEEIGNLSEKEKQVLQGVLHQLRRMESEGFKTVLGHFGTLDTEESMTKIGLLCILSCDPELIRGFMPKKGDSTIRARRFE